MRPNACLAEKRLEMAEVEASIQGYADGVFWEKNTFNDQGRSTEKQYQCDQLSHQPELLSLGEISASMEKKTYVLGC